MIKGSPLIFLLEKQNDLHKKLIYKKIFVLLSFENEASYD